MNFISLSFVGAVCGALLLYYLVPLRFRWYVLLAVSVVFYLAGGLKAGLFLLFTAGTNYVGGLLLSRINDRRASLTPEQKKTEDHRIKAHKKWVLVPVLLLNFGLLFLVKYWNFTAESIGKLVGDCLPRMDWIMPVGLSFYMFQSVGYLVDCYRGKYTAEKNFLKFSLFVSFFPQMVQGPISRFDQLHPQLIRGNAWNGDNVKYGLQLALWGYLKRMLIADRAALVVNEVFGHSEKYGGAVCAFGVLFYCIQLYCDFSGGIDITRGVAQMFGIDMAENFKRPFFATGMADYWRRWHVTLGSWMRDYVFYPLSFSKAFAKLSRWARKRFKGKVGKVIPTATATFIVYLVIGIWHGANFRYIAYGLYNGTILTSSVLLANTYSQWKKKLHIRDTSGWFRAFAILRTAAIVFVGRYITRPPRLLVGYDMLKKTLTSPCLYQLRDGTLGTFGLQIIDYAVVALGFVTLLLLEWKLEQGNDLRKTLETKHPVVQWLCLFIALALLCVFGIFRDSGVRVEFIYQQY